MSDNKIQPSFSKDFIAFRKEQAIKWRDMEKKQKEEDEKICCEKKIIEDKKQKEEDERIRREKKIIEDKKNLLNIYFAKMTSIILDVENAKNIIQIDALVATFNESFKESKELIFELDKKEFVIDKISELTIIISNNPNTKFDIRKNGYEAKAHVRISNHMVKMLEQLGCCPDILQIETMDTSGDEEFARTLAQQLNSIE